MPESLASGAGAIGPAREWPAAHKRRPLPREERLRRLVEASFEGIIISEDGIILDANEQVASLFGYEVDEVIGRASFEFVAPEYRPAVIEAVTSGHAGPYEVEALRKDGSHFWAELKARTWREGGRTLRVTAVQDVTARREVERALQESEERYRLLVETTTEGICIVDDDTTILFANPALGKIFGRLPEEMLGKRASEFIPEAYRAERAADRAKLLEQGLSHRFESPYAKADGSLVWLLITTAPIPEQDGTSRVLAAVTDITARKAAEDELRKRERRWRNVLDSLQDIYFETDLEGTLTFQSTSAARMYGRPADSMIGMHTPDLYVDPSRNDALVAILQSGRRVQDFEAEFLTETGSVHVSINCSLIIEDGVAVGTSGTVRDITSRKHAEEARRESEQRYRQIVETAMEGICLLDADGRITFANPALAAMVGLSVEELTGRSVSEFIAPEWREQRRVDRRAGWRRGHPERYEAQYVRPDGGVVRAMVSISPIERPDGRFAALAMLTDVTERRRSEERLELHIQHSPLAVIQWDTDFRVVEWNPAAERIFGYTREQALGQHAYDLIIKGIDPEELESRWQHMLSAPKPRRQVSENRTRDGRSVVCEWFHTPLVDDLGRVIGVASMAQDITDTKQLAEERDRIFELSLDMLAVIAQGGEIKRVNPAWERTLGFREDEVVGSNIFRLVHPEDREMAMREAVRTEHGEPVVDLRARARCADGSYRWLSWNVTPVTGGVTYAVARDISALVVAEEEQTTMVNALEANARALAEQARELDRLRIEAEHLATYDMLTGVRNRRAWFFEAERAAHSAIALFDIDHFKRINDTLGHPAGDTVLQTVAARLAQALHGVAMIGRVGGEEFGAAFSIPLREAREACERAIASISREPVRLPSGHELLVTISGGLAPWRSGMRSLRDALQVTYEEADAALYEAKAAGRRRLVTRRYRAA